MSVFARLSMRLFTGFTTGLTVMLALTACQSNSPVLDVGQFAPYVSKFEDTSAQFGNRVQVTNLVIRFGQLQSAQERGLCVIDGDNPPTITVREDTWNLMSESEREELLFHEMGHCVLHRRHNATITSDGLPASIMNPYLIQGAIFQSYQGYYLNELFHPVQ